ncbi:MAG: ribose-5-phosphate isomerase RpiA [Anaerolineales bacterium]|nr:ribose-5-phosphate isomerase RpiA [Anaerolineales bacterium]
MTVAHLKQAAAEKAVEAVHSGMVVGLGTGSTAVFMVRAIGQLLQDGRLQHILGIPTSEATAREAERVGIPLTTLNEHPVIDVTIDGADEISPQLDLIKGLGGALLREKIVATASRRMIVVGDGSKKVARLGTRAPLPVEVIPFAQGPVQAYLASLSARPVLRVHNGVTFITDEGNIILDCHFDEGIDDPELIGQAIRQQPGVVEHGLFLGLAETAVVATNDTIEVLGKRLS